MSVFEQLRPFVGLCQACGFFPYTIENNLNTKKFERFTFSFRHLTTWWFFLISFLQLIVVFGLVYFSWKQVDNINEQNIPITMSILFVIGWFFVIAKFLTSRRMMLHYRKLRNAVEAVQEVERLFGEKIVVQLSTSVTTRLTIGSILTVIGAMGIPIEMAPVYKTYTSPNTGILSITVALFILSLASVMFDCTFLFIHLCYYVISRYIQLVLRYPICHLENESNEQATSNQGTENVKLLRRNALIFHYLCRASSELNDVFSFHVFYILSDKFVSVISFSVAYVYSFIHQKTFLEDYGLMIPYFLVTDWARILVLLTAFDMPVHQVRLLRARVTAISCTGSFQTMAEKIATMSTLLQIDEDRIRLSALGIFKVGMHLVPALTGAVVTYMVILLNNN